MTWNQKETSFLQDLQKQEQVCVDKYNRYAASACDQQLKTMFEQIGQVEQGHYDTIGQLLKGTVPPMTGTAQNAAAPVPTYEAGTSNTAKDNDSYLCADALATEKHVSAIYNTSIFEFASPAARDMLNHIQKEEQGHGKRIYDYMTANGMYQ